MTPQDFKRSVDFIFSNVFNLTGCTPTYISGQYLGGELLTIPFAELEECVLYLRSVAAHHGIQLRDGCQTNMIGTPVKIDRLYRLFEGRISTSLDDFGNSRTVNKSADQYKMIWRQADTFLSKNRRPVGGVLVLDETGLANAHSQVMLAARAGRMITVRPLFQGGTPGQQLQSEESTLRVLTGLLDLWFMRLPIIVEPFFHLVTQRLATKVGKVHGPATSSCAFQADCVQRSLNLEPNGDLFVCFEMADAGLGRLGNALTGEWNEDLVQAMSARPDHLSDDCRECEYLAECRGGCMFESIERGTGMYGKSSHCLSWKALFKQIDETIDLWGVLECQRWLARLDARYQNQMSDGLTRINLEALEVPV